MRIVLSRFLSMNLNFSLFISKFTVRTLYSTLHYTYMIHISSGFQSIVSLNTRVNAFRILGIEDFDQQKIKRKMENIFRYLCLPFFMRSRSHSFCSNDEIFRIEFFCLGFNVLFHSRIGYRVGRNEMARK